LVAATKRRDALEAQVIETKALRRSDVLKTTLLRSVSHDLRSPLTAITAAAAGLRSETLAEVDRRELVSVIESEAARLSRLVDNLLDLSRLEGGGAEPRRDWHAPEEIVKATLEAVSAPAGGVDLSVEPDLPLIEVDAVQLERALANVLDNAATHGGGVALAVRVRCTDPHVAITVSDRGPGMPRDQLLRVFEPFHGGGEHAGAGLGLAIARGFVEVNGGRIAAESTPGEGTSVTIRLPAAAGRAVVA
jgi:two-component system sensor histidine kinase KdpD